MDIIIEAITQWIKDFLIEAITGNLEDMKKRFILSRKNSVLIMSYRLLCTLMKSM